MGNTYVQKKRHAQQTQTETSVSTREADRAAVHRGAVPAPHRVDLPDRMREKMETAFGTELSAVRLFESPAVADFGAKAVTQGSNITFAPGLLDFSSFGGQALLGHELSHVVSQARGETRGSGFLQDSSLEARADREGAMAAAGQQISLPTAALSSVSSAPAAGPMQAKKDKKKPQEDVELEDLDAPEKEEPAPAPAKPVKSNGLFETALSGVVSAKDQIESIADPLSDIGKLKKNLGEKLNSAGDMEKKLGGKLGVGLMKNGGISSFAGKKANGVLDKMKSKGYEQKAKKLLSGSKAAATYAAAPLALMKVGSSYDKLDKAEEFGTQQDRTNAQFDLAGANLNMAKKSASVVQTIAKSAGKKKLEDLSKKTGTGVGLAAQGASLIKNIQNIHEATARKQSMRKSAEAFAAPGRELSEDDQEKAAIFKQATGQAGLDQKQASFNAVSNALGLGSSAIRTVGAVPLSESIDTVKKVFDTVTGEVMSYETDKFQENTVDEKLHTEDAAAAFKKEQADKLRAFHVSPEAYKKSFLRSHGYSSGKTGEAYEGITGDRADLLMEGAEKNEGWAKDFASNAGIDTDKIALDDDHRKAIRSSFVKSLGGDEDREFHSSNVMEYNAFQKDAEENLAETRTTGQIVKDALKGFGKSSWESVKTGGKKALNGIKRTGLAAAGLVKDGWDTTKGLAKKGWSGLVRGAKGLKELITSKDARAEAWDTIKTGAGKAWQTIKTGAGNAVDKTLLGLQSAGKAIGKGARTAATGIKNFATNANVRKKVWNGVKAGAGRAWESTKTGAEKAAAGVSKALRYAGDVTKHGISSRVERIQDWYHEGVDQMNVHGDTYKNMGLGARFLWTAKNLPARMLHGTEKNRLGTVSRFNKALTADEAVARMKEIEEKKKQAQGA